MLKSKPINVGKEVDKFFDNSSLAKGNSPKMIIVTGGNAAGKTTLIKEKYSKGYVVINAEGIYRNIKIFDDFGLESQELVNEIGAKIAQRAINENRNVILEMIGHKESSMKFLIDAVVAAGYKVDVKHVHADPVEAYQWHMKAISGDKGYLPTTNTEEFHRDWVLSAVQHLSKTKGQGFLKKR